MREGVRRRRPFALDQPTDLPPEPPGPHRIRAGSERPQLLVVKKSMRLYPPAEVFWTRDRRRLRDRRLPRACGNASHNEPVGHAPRPTLLQESVRVPTGAVGRRLDRDVPPYAYFPFGGGPRLCIGRSFARTEAMLLLTTLARKFRLQLGQDRPGEPQPSITLRPKTGIRVMLARR